MTSEEVQRLVDAEISGLLSTEWSLTPAQRLDLRKGLLPPQLRNYYDCGGSPPEDPPSIIRLWLVSEGMGGCNIVYSEDAAKYGLAVPGRSPLEVVPDYFNNLTRPEPGVDTFIGYYGGFLETYFAI